MLSFNFILTSKVEFTKEITLLIIVLSDQFCIIESNW